MTLLVHLLSFVPPYSVLNPFSSSVRGDNESEVDVYSNHYEGSVDSHTGPMYPSGVSNYSDMPGPRGSKDPYPAWTADKQIPMSTE